MSGSEIDLKRRKLSVLASMVPVVTLLGCGGGEDSAPAAAKPKADAKPEEPAAKPEAAAQAEADQTASAEPAEESTAEAGTDQAMADAETEAAAQPAMEPDSAAGELPKLEESDESAKALSYQHDASQLDQSAYPTLTAESRCANCQLYQGGDSPWGACPIFPGKQVKATGWCTAYTPKAS